MTFSLVQDPLVRYRTPAVRHLAWLTSASQLLGGPTAFDLQQHLPRDLAPLLDHWDRHPEDGRPLLREPPPRRLGEYFERLYECLLTDICGWQLLARNLPVRDSGTTLGEFDFLLRNPATKCVEHHEIAVKFYLGYMTPGHTLPLWYGPNARDRLDIKVQRMLGHQISLSRLPQTQHRLQAQGIEPPDVVRTFMPGYLFHPTGKALPTPEIPPGYSHGEWLHFSEHTTVDVSSWVPLSKPNWLGPWQQQQPPDAAQVEFALGHIRTRQVPQLFAKLARENDRWIEVRRFFVVPDDWPGTPSLSPT